MILSGITALPLLQMAYRGQVQLTPQQMRAAIEALPFEVPKLSATAIATMDERSFAAAAMHDSLDHNVLAPFSSRIGGSGFSHAAENIAYGYADFASTLKQWINSAGHRANLLLHGAKWIGVAHAQNGHRTYWALVIGAK